MTSNDPHVKLLRKAFGDLKVRPFAWCFDEENEDQPAAAPQEPRAIEGETYISSWSELLHAMTDGQIGTPPQKSLRRYEPQTTTTTTTQQKK